MGNASSSSDGSYVTEYSCCQVSHIVSSGFYVGVISFYVVVNFLVTGGGIDDIPCGVMAVVLPRSDVLTYVLSRI